MGDDNGINTELFGESMTTMMHPGKKKKQRLNFSSSSVSSSVEVTIAQEDETESNVDHREGMKLRECEIRRSSRKRKPPTRFGEDANSGLKRSKRLVSTRRREILPNDIRCSFPILGLPSEILLYIFTYLDVRTVVSLASVCQAFYQLANDQSIWRGLCYTKWRICDVITYGESRWKDLYIDGNRRTQRGWFRYVIPNFSEKSDSLESFYSEHFLIGTHTWTVLLFPQGNIGSFLSIYLSVKGTQPSGGREASFSFVLINQKDPSKSVEKGCAYGNFVAEENSENEDWGFTKFIDLEKLSDPNEGFLVNDTLIFDIYVANLSEFDYWMTLINTNDENLQLEATNAFAQSSFVDENKLAIVQKGGLPAILRLLRSHNVELQKSASDALWNLTEEDKNKQLILAMGWFNDYWSQIISLLVSSNAEVQKNIVNVCWNLSTIDDFNRKIAQNGGIEALIILLLSDVVELHLSAVHVLWNLSFTDDEIRDRIVQLGAIKPLSRLLFSDDEDVLANTINLLRNLAEEGENSHEILQVLNLNVIMTFIHHSNPEIVKNTLYLLANLVEGNATFILAIEERGGVRDLISLLYSENEEIVGEAAKTLSRLMYYHKMKAVENRIINRLLDMLKSKNKKKIENGILALLRVALHEQNKITITELGGLDIIIPLLSNPDFGIQGDSSILVTNLATNTDNRRKILEKGGLETLIPLLNSPDKYPKKFAACAIATLSKDKLAQKRLIEERPLLESLVTYLLSSTDCLEGYSHICYAIVKMKKYHDQITELIKDHGLIPSVLQSVVEYDPVLQPSRVASPSSELKSEERKDTTPPHILLCCKINLLGYFALIEGVNGIIRNYGGEAVLQSLLTKFDQPQITFLANWALRVLRLGENAANSLTPAFTTTGFVKVLPELCQIRNDSCFFETTLRTSKYVTGNGKYYFEVECVSSSTLCLIGWATKNHKFQIAERRGIGDDKESWSFELRRGIKWHDNYPVSFGEIPSKGSNLGPATVGCVLDLDHGEMSFIVNGKSFGVAFTSIDPMNQYCPAISLTSGQQCHLNFGARPFKYSLPNGCIPFDN